MVLIIGTHQWNRMRQSSVNESRDSICQVEATTTGGRWFRAATKLSWVVAGTHGNFLARGLTTSTWHTYGIDVNSLDLHITTQRIDLLNKQHVFLCMYKISFI